jgi:hypothetical protein
VTNREDGDLGRPYREPDILGVYLVRRRNTRVIFAA